MLFRGSETIELKEVVTDDIKKKIIAFANCDGGRLYIGVQDDGTVVGLDDPDGVSLQKKMRKKLSLWIFSAERSVLTILPKR